MELQPLNRLFIGTVLAGALSAPLAVATEAKELQDYGNVTIQITGADGAHRTVVAASPGDRHNASYLVSELGMVTSANVVTADPPGLSGYLPARGHAGDRLQGVSPLDQSPEC